ncbi:MAG TPA: DUF11 domain-containing protein, partial [Chloroflexi bacterium]|nr:DUF11 domain-containing protein [Chloroflexota bacterium]
MFKTQFVKRSSGRGRDRCAILSIILCVVFFSFMIPTPVNALPAGFQEYLVMGDEYQIYRMFNDLRSSGSFNTEMVSIVTIVATSNGQQIYYDHWEDGYEEDIFNPTQPTTLVFGDGDPSNGDSGHGNDTLAKGVVLTLKSSVSGAGNVVTGTINVASSRDANEIRFDSRDRIVTTGGPVNVVHAVWPHGETYIGGSWEIYSFQAWQNGTSYTIPVGEDSYTDNGGASGPFADFKHVWLEVQAAEDNTNLTIDNGNTTINLTLNREDTYGSNGWINDTSADAITINAGTTVNADKPVQAGLVTGSDGTYQTRFFAMIPDVVWGTEYLAPVTSTSDDSVDSQVYIFNPNDFDITVNASDRTGSGSFNVPAFSAYTYSQGMGRYVPQDSAARLKSEHIFWAVGSHDFSKTPYDWGYSLIPVNFLTSDYYVSWAPGSANDPPTENGSPVHVTPRDDNTTFYVDYSPTDGVVDRTFTLDALERELILDPDNDNTGMHIWTDNKPFMAVWGETPPHAGRAFPYLDLGTTILPLYHGWLDPILSVDKTATPQILPSTGGVVTFKLDVASYDKIMNDVNVTDTLPAGWTYVPDSTSIVYPDGSSADLNPAIDGQNLVWNLNQDLYLNEMLQITFDAQVDSLASAAAINKHVGVAAGTYMNNLFEASDETFVYISDLSLDKTVDKDEAPVGEEIVYTLSYTNSGAITSTNATIRDVIPVNTTYTGRASDGGTYNPSNNAIVWDLGEVAPSHGGVVTFSVTLNRVPDGTIIENSATIDSDQTSESTSNVVRTTVLAPALSLSKSAPTTAVDGDTITYTISYANTGGASATGVIVSDTIPANTTYVTGSMAINDGAGSGWVALTDADDGDAGHWSSAGSAIGVAPGVVSGTLEPGESGQIRFAVTVDPGTPEGARIGNVARIDSEQTNAKSSNMATTNVSPLTIEKAAERAVATAGEIVEFTVTYENKGSLTLNDVYLIDAIPQHTTLVSGTVTGPDMSVEYSIDHGQSWSSSFTDPGDVTSIRWHRATLISDTQGTVGFQARLDDPLPGNTTIRNEVRITSTETAASGWLYSNQVSVGTVDLSIVKSANAAFVRDGDTITYTITYGNGGSTAASGAAIVDQIPAHTTYVPGSITGAGADDSDPARLVWHVGAIPANSGGYKASFAVTVDSDTVPGTAIDNTTTLTDAHDSASSRLV